MIPDLHEIADRIAIAELKARYCRMLDTRDWAGYADCFTADLMLDTRPSGGALIEGRDAVVAFVRASLEGVTTCHHVHSPEMTIAGDRADVIWAMQDRLIWGPERAARAGNAGLTGYGHYHERCERRDGRWRIAAQVLTRLHIEFHPPAGGARG